MNSMSEEEALSLFTLAGFRVLKIWKLHNRYWCNRPDAPPWWLVLTDRGCVEIGWRKRVIAIHWGTTEMRCVVTEDNVTKSEEVVHAWSRLKAAEYLMGLYAKTSNPHQSV